MLLINLTQHTLTADELKGAVEAVMTFVMKSLNLSPSMDCLHWGNQRQREQTSRNLPRYACESCSNRWCSVLHGGHWSKRSVEWVLPHSMRSLNVSGGSN